MRKGKANGDVPVRRRRGGKRALLATEVEFIIRERERLLRAAGAAAALFMRINIQDVPSEAREPVRRLGVVLDALPEETLTDAIELLIGHSRRSHLAGAAG